MRKNKKSAKVVAKEAGIEIERIEESDNENNGMAIEKVPTHSKISKGKKKRASKNSKIVKF